MDIVIIGAGVSGLVAAIELEKKGHKSIILESSYSVGGRVKTESFKGFLLDHGFQVLLTEYPEARRYLNYDELDLRYFNPGAAIFNEEGEMEISDPLRKPGKLVTMLFSKVGTIADKLKMHKLSSYLKNEKVEDLFIKQSKTTLEYLKDKGFSDRIIANFFQPFFAGIFLDKELKTSSRMFEFVFKMFSQGHAAIPANGMQEIPKQLANQLKESKIRFNTKVQKVESKKVFLHDGSLIEADKIIIATDPSRLLNGFKPNDQTHKKVTNLYFSAENSLINDSLIGLVPEKKFIINNFNFPTDVSNSYSDTTKVLLSVTVIDNAEPMTKTKIDKVKEEMKTLSKGKCGELTFLKSFEIRNALPVVEDMQYDIASTSTRIMDDVFLAGDYLLYPSLNGAMMSGRLAAEGVLNSI